MGGGTSANYCYSSSRHWARAYGMLRVSIPSTCLSLRCPYADVRKWTYDCSVLQTLHAQLRILLKYRGASAVCSKTNERVLETNPPACPEGQPLFQVLGASLLIGLMIFSSRLTQLYPLVSTYDHMSSIVARHWSELRTSRTTT